MEFKFNNEKLKTLRKTLRQNQTDAERMLWMALKAKRLLSLKFYRQYSVGNYILDFYCPKKKLAIELDGGQHAKEENRILDNNRTLYLYERGIKVVRFWNNDVLNNIEGVSESIISVVRNNSPYPPLA